MKRLLPDLLSLGYYRHPWLGIRHAYRLSPTLGEVLQLPVDKGLLLVQLVQGSPLDQAGILGAQREAVIGNQLVYVGGDILLAVDGMAIESISHLETFLEDNYQVGNQVTVAFLREGTRIEVTVGLVEEPN